VPRARGAEQPGEQADASQGIQPLDDGTGKEAVMHAGNQTVPGEAGTDTQEVCLDSYAGQQHTQHAQHAQYIPGTVLSDRSHDSTSIFSNPNKRSTSMFVPSQQLSLAAKVPAGIRASTPPAAHTAHPAHLTGLARPEAVEHSVGSWDAPAVTAAWQDGASKVGSKRELDVIKGAG
jgi:hypothetical protein